MKKTKKILYKQYSNKKRKGKKEKLSVGAQNCTCIYSYMSEIAITLMTCNIIPPGNTLI